MLEHPHFPAVAFLQLRPLRPIWQPGAPRQQSPQSLLAIGDQPERGQLLPSLIKPHVSSAFPKFCVTEIRRAAEKRSARTRRDTLG